MKRSPLRKVSKKRAIENEEYKILGRKFLIQNPECRGCGREATQVHHRSQRHGKLLNKVEEWIPICFECHTSVHFISPHRARELDLLK